MVKTNIKGISKELSKILQEYSEEIEIGMIQASEKVAKKTVEKLKSTSPKGKGKRKGSYAKGWRVSNIDGKKIIHNKTDYQLTHLLENGHAKIGGGRVAAIVHIKPAEEQAIKDFIEETEKVIRG